ncbi:hypothetical protein HNQ93_003103 [Hymenobacter luteus]|uniref:Uncharacterized protein n=2 Tax=Hymenobacter TaxID=89966 RepID=A0A7W9T276_9BACT|nr:MULTISPECIES: hypothetical protein [Hymenobacter]MBB4602345.1 hypothetical protein [Hymenobacter latericoloratus]MBB6060237.1 hypothetical protein [Hymenobacter luteus]
MRHLPSFSRLLPALGLALALLPGCYSRSDMKSEEGAVEVPQDGTPTEAPGAVPARTPEGTPTPAAGPNAQPLQAVNVFLEVSGSMEGFMPKTGVGGENTKFQQHVAQFLSEVNRSTAARQKTFYRIKERPYKDSYPAISGTVRNGIQQPAKSTDIPSVLDTLMTNYYRPGTVSVLISDFIYSPKNAGAIPYIKTDIADALARSGQKSDLAVSVYGYTSDFRGTYYPALKAAGKKTNCCDTEIPYYIWVVGPASAVRQFDAALLEQQPAKQVHFGVTYPQPVYSALNKFQNKGSWYYGDAGASKRTADTYRVISVAEASAQQPVEFVVGLDLSGLPGQYRDVAYLKQNLKLQGVDTDAKLLDVFAATSQTKASSGPESRFTHFAKVGLTRQPKAARPLVLRLQDQRPAWVAQWTTKNDATPAPKTFALSSLLDGLEQQEGEKRPIFELPMTLQPAE